MSIPFASCVTPTYGRYPTHGHLLEEAVESFLRQDYTWPRELLILNDCPQQTLVCDAPNVRVINAPARYASLGAKYNAAIEAAEHEIILPWEDDDLSLPHRISQAVTKLSDGSGCFNPQRSFFLDGRGLHHNHTHGVCHNASAFTRAAWRLAGKYPEISGAQDAVMDGRLKAVSPIAEPLPQDPRLFSYIYRFGVSDCHVSGAPNHDEFYRRWGERPVTPGTFTIRPHWRKDYAALCRQAAPQ